VKTPNILDFLNPVDSVSSSGSGASEQTNRKSENICEIKPKPSDYEHCSWFNLGLLSKDTKFLELINQLLAECSKTQVRSSRQRNANVLLTNLYHQYSIDPTLFTAIRMDGNHYRKDDPENIYKVGPSIIKIVKDLEEMGYLHIKIGYSTYKKRTGRITRILPTDKLKQLFEGVKYEFCSDIKCEGNASLAEAKSCILLRDKDPVIGKSINLSFEPTADTQRMEQQLSKYNDLLSWTFIDIPSNQDGYIKLKNQRRLLLGQVHQPVVRIFSRGDFDLHGRFYHSAIQQLPSQEREKLFIDGNPTVELDFTGLHIVLAYALKGICYWATDGKDPYILEPSKYPEWFREFPNKRQCVKLLMTCLINCTDLKSAYKGFRYKASSGSVEKTFTDEQLASLSLAVVKRHLPIVDTFRRDSGIRLMRFDSEIAAHVINHFTDLEIPVLCIHDSFIVEQKFIRALEKAMREGFQKVTGVCLGGEFRQSIKANVEFDEKGQILNPPISRSMRYMKRLMKFLNSRKFKRT